MNILCITHADFETPGVIEAWAQKQKHHFTISRPYRGDKPSAENVDYLIVMGGPQSACDLDSYPYLADEIALIKAIAAHDKPILGFCLGAQLIGEAFGGKAEKSPHREVGVYFINCTAESKYDPLIQHLPASFAAMHWHNDMPGLTEDAVILASSAGCPRQIIRYADKIYGFQCHLEMTRENVLTLVDACPEDLKPGQFVQSKADFETDHFIDMNELVYQIVEKLSYF